MPHVACFDTTFHLTLPAAAATYPLPREWRHRWALRRVGFHGLSHAYVARRAADLAGSHPSRRIVSCHLGSGASVCAIEAGRSIDTTMGMTPMEGLMMVTRSGTIDPGLLLWLLDGGGLTVEEVSEGLNTRSGLAGIAGGSGDMRDVVHRRARSDPEATLAFDIYVHRLRQGIAAMAASLGGVDVLAFTGGVGQHMAEVRAVTVAGLAHLGLAVDHDRNRGTSDDADISARDAPARCVVVATGEHHSIAAETRRPRRVRPQRGTHMPPTPDPRPTSRAPLRSCVPLDLAHLAMARRRSRRPRGPDRVRRTRALAAGRPIDELPAERRPLPSRAGCSLAGSPSPAPGAAHDVVGRWYTAFGTARWATIDPRRTIWCGRRSHVGRRDRSRRCARRRHDRPGTRRRSS
ncbi:MAG: hypothetical protein R2713_08240 [Ilumatobacteraceae bacterium]